MSVLTKEFYRVLILRTVGNFLILSSLFLMAKTFYEPVRQEIRYFVETKFSKRYLLAEDAVKISPLENAPRAKPALLANLLQIKPVEIITPEDPNFAIVVPKIAANARVLANVDAGEPTAYLAALKQGVAHAAGTAFPGEGGHIFLFAHSTDYFFNVSAYNGVFYLLTKLEVSDEINLFWQNQRFVYRVIGKKIVDPSQVEYLTRKTNREFLTLQTCWPPGTTFKRLLVFAVRVAE